MVTQLMSADIEVSEKASKSFDEWSEGLVWPDTTQAKAAAPCTIKRGAEEVQLDFFEEVKDA